MLPPIITRRQRPPSCHKKNDDDIIVSSSKCCDHHHSRHNNHSISSTAANEKYAVDVLGRSRRGGGERRAFYWNVIHPFITYGRRNGNNYSIVVVSLLSCIVVALVAVVLISIVIKISNHDRQHFNRHRNDDMDLPSTARNQPPISRHDDDSIPPFSKFTPQREQKQRYQLFHRNPRSLRRIPHEDDNNHHQNERNQIMNELPLVLAMEEEERLQSAAAAAARRRLPPPDDDRRPLDSIVEEREPSWTSDERLSYHRCSRIVSSRLEIPLSPSASHRGTMMAWMKLSSNDDGRESSGRRLLWMTTSGGGGGGGCADGSAVGLLYVSTEGTLSYDYTGVDGSCVTISSSSSSGTAAALTGNDGWIMVALEWETTTTTTEVTLTVNDDVASRSKNNPPARIYPRSKSYLGSDDEGRHSLEGYLANVGVMAGVVRPNKNFLGDMFRARTGSEMVEMMRDVMMERGCDERREEEEGGGCVVAFYSLREFQDTSSSSAPNPILVESLQGLNGHKLPPLALPNSNNDNDNNNGGPYTISFMTDSTSTTRQRTVAAALHHAFHSYHQHSDCCDTFHPLSYDCPDDDSKGSVSLMAALDALYVTSPNDDFVKAQRFIRKNGLWNMKTTVTVPEDAVGEVLAGLLAGYDVSREQGLLSIAVELGQKILVDLDRRRSNLEVMKRDDREEVWIDLTRMTMEWRYLGYLTGDGMFESVVTERINRLTSTWSSSLDNNKPHNKWESVDGNVLLKGVTCLLRLWLLGEKREVLLRTIYDDVMDEIHERMVRRTDLTGLVYLEYPKRVMGAAEEMWKGVVVDHDDCAMAGTLALGAHTHPDSLTSTNAQRDLLTATSLATTCHEMYTRTVSGLSPHLIKIKPGGDFATPSPPSPTTSNDDVFFDLNSYYDLSPSFIESLFVLYQVTHDNRYRDWGWSLFLSIERYAKIAKGYGYVVDVYDESMEEGRGGEGEGVGDEMAVWFMGRTLKFLYLLFEDDEGGRGGGGVDVLTTHVMNTKSHPLRIIKAKEVSK